MKLILSGLVSSLAVLGLQAEATNLIQNGGFEESDTPMNDQGYMYIDGNTSPKNWAAASSCVRINAAGSGIWNSGQAFTLAGDYTIGLQRDGSIWQTVTIPSDGYYELTWEAGRRLGNPDHTVNIMIDGQKVCAATTTWDYWAHKPFTTGAIWLTAGNHDIGFQGVNVGVDATSFIDDVALTAVEVTDVHVTEGTQEIGYPPPSGKLTVDRDASVSVAASSHGILGTFRTLPTGAWPFSTFAYTIYSLPSFQYWTRFNGPIATQFLSAANDAVFSVGDEFEGTLPDAFKEGGAQGNEWVAEWNSILTIPESGLYTFRASVDDAFIMALDGRGVFQSQDCVTTIASVYLEKGPHTCYIGLLDNANGAKLELKVKGPGESEFKGLPLAWFTPLTGPNGLEGSGDVAPADGTALVVAQSPFDTPFTGRLTGTGTGALVVNEKANGSAGRVELSDVTGGVPYLANGELAVTATGRDLESVGSSLNDGTLTLIGAKSVKTLYGGQKTVLGEAGIHVEQFQDDASSGISSDKTYTHLKSFPLSSTSYPTVNGVTFDGRGEMDGVGPSGPYTFSSGWTGVKSLFNTFNYGNGELYDAQFTFVLKGLTPGQMYDYRFYFLAWGTDPATIGRFATFTFEGQDQDGNAVTFGTRTDDVNVMVGGVAQQSMGVIGCRYVAGADGQLKISVVSANKNNTVHCYAFSNELAGEVNTLTLAPTAGTRASLLAELTGSDKVVVDGAGEQMLGGAVTLGQPVDVKGKLVLTKGADVRSGVNLTGGTLEVRGGAKLSKLAGSGAVDFRWGDRHPFGVLQDDGTFADAPAFRVEHFTGDADSGVSPTKKYFAAFNYLSGASDGNPVYDTVNEVGFRRLAPNGGNACDFRAAHLSMNGVPSAMHAGNPETIGLAADQVFSTIFSSFCYGNPAGQESAEVKSIAINGLSVGETYEARFYERLWSDPDTSTRQVKLIFANAEGVEEEHTVYIDREAAAGPYYIAVRFTATTYSYTIKHVSPDTANTWHLYAATLEKVDDAANRRVLDLADDASFAGAVTGCGFVEKMGVGKLTLAGAVDAPGCWLVEKGAVLLEKAASTLGTVAVGAQGTFGGVGQIAGDLGVAAGGTLVVGAEGLTIGGRLVIGEGAKIVVNGKGTIKAKSAKLPADLTLQAAEGKIERLSIVADELTLNATGASGWTVRKADGSADSVGVKVGANSVRVSRGGAVILVR